MSEYFLLFMSAVIVNNFVLTRFLGLCIFFGVSKDFDASVGMGMAVTAVITLSSLFAWLVYTYVLVPLNVTFLTTITFVLLIACFVQLLEMIVKKYTPTLYKLWGIYLLLIAANCVVLGVPLINVESGFNFGKSVVNAFGSGVGFAVALVLMASLREKLRLADVPKSLQGLGIAFILAGCLALSFFGFSGMIS
ncbi:MAG TPA: RnfABCDGE type electron transport complex subunit A [Syntrophaceticus sp.]|jgi:electron transport complex protein RnfA|uniref:Ion-translocating oxidoreductase complex subunit A n=1 Tax=Syntrophaceticus schinkii TaxID=499207 RepID=A0A0B7MGS4_9FIRM|nr:RnfABCDGE type electron transport complex subunit A [Syntrophaceticus schinkii]MDD2361199.1 RnfABCDGE type electron transport complex subunit A [Syntrophaceticus schinkii]MDD4675478.1 RnfABCDGE type electron transport complex subunit A [Syntrophaceticus schinkii]CEO89255.1 Electron transport complex protein RnfA [Syntrophaceticus schinkii]HHY30239.1 RnfABCDGE type electron transport complex subunit A [Syntrophaceticus sp.]